MGWWKESIDIVKKNDPAARTSLEVLLTYPGLKALAAHRISHFLWRHHCRLLARMHSQFWRFWTQIEIHPGAQIAEGVFIDHGSGLVIGETAILGDNITLYQGVTLGGTGKEQGKRHPTLEDNVLVGAGAKVLGSFTIGRNSKIAAGSVVLEEVPPYSTVVGVPGIVVKRNDEAVPCYDLDQVHIPHPVQNELKRLSDENTKLREMIDQINNKIKE
mgnify:CR=1 FL=1